jgi:hypothetical protein
MTNRILTNTPKRQGHRKWQERDPAAKEELRKLIGEHLLKLDFWNDITSRSGRAEHIAKLPIEEVAELHATAQSLLTWLKESLGERKARGQLKNGPITNKKDRPYGFALVSPEITKIIGFDSCNMIGRKMCEVAEFNVKRLEEIIAALELRLSQP